ncbi:MAG: NADP-dependent oxidoreductase [Bacteroidales bacterium]
MKNKQIILKSRPIGTPTNDNFEFQAIDIPTISKGEILIKSKFISVDPYMRGRMNDSKSYVPPFELGKALDGGVVAEVIESQSSKFQKGDYILGNLPWKIYNQANENKVQKISSLIQKPIHALGVLGMPGMTAYFGLLDITNPQPGETIVVSGAAGAVGSLVGQIGKIKGCRVIGIVGSDEKAGYITHELNYDQAFNYNTCKDLKTTLREVCPNGIDIYFDNVGGTISDAVISNINFGARISLCGQISLYNAKEIPVGPRLQPVLLTRSALMQGFIVKKYAERFPEGIQQMGQWIKEGKIISRENIISGFDNIPDAFLGLFRGDNIGKQIVEIL